MTTDAKPRLKITYATLRNDNEELHALYEAGIVAEPRPARGLPPQPDRRPGAGRRGRDDRPLADRPRHHRRQFRQGHRARTCATRSPPPGPSQPAWAATALARAPRDHPAGRRADQRAPDGVRRGRWPSRSARAASRRSARSRRRPTSCATTPTSMERNDGYDHPMDNLGDTAVHTRSILRPLGVFAVISPFNFPMALSAGPTGGGADRRQHGGLQAEHDGAAVGRSTWSRRIATPACRTAPSTWSWAPATRSARSCRRTRASTGSSSPARIDVGFAAVQARSRPASREPAIVEMGGKNPAIVTAPRRPRRGGRGDRPFGLRLQRPEVLGQQPRLRRAAGPRRAGQAARREDRGAHDRRSARPRELDGPGHRPARGRPPPAGDRPRPVATARSSSAASG